MDSLKEVPGPLWGSGRASGKPWTVRFSPRPQASDRVNKQTSELQHVMSALKGPE